MQRTGRRAFRRSAHLCRAIRSFAESLESRLLLSTYTVTSLADSGPGTLRDAITNSPASTIQFSVAGMCAPVSATRSRKTKSRKSK